MIIKILIENTSENDMYLTEHGLSLYIETKTHRILFDTGQSGAFIQNAKSLNIDLNSVDLVFLSHGHYDHGGGLLEFLEINKHAKIYINENAFSDLYSVKSKGNIVNIGISKSLLKQPQLILLSGNCIIDDELEVLSQVTDKFKSPSMNDTLMVKTKHNQKLIFTKDTFNHEQNLIIRYHNKHLLLAGCAHHGITNILESFHNLKGFYPDTVISGFHLSSTRSAFVENYESLSEISNYLSKTNTQYFTGHCTGLIPLNFLKERLGNQVQSISSGQCIIL